MSRRSDEEVYKNTAQERERQRSDRDKLFCVSTTKRQRERVRVPRYRADKIVFGGTQNFEQGHEAYENAHRDLL